MNRVSRIRGQLNGVEKLLERSGDCAAILQQLAACRGVLNGLMTEILEDHVRYQIAYPETAPRSEQGEVAEQLVILLRSSLR